MAQPVEQLHPLPGLDDPRPLLLGGRKVRKQRLVPGLDQLPVDRLADLARESWRNLAQASCRQTCS